MIKESKRCLQCRNPRCEIGCPLHIPLREIIKYVADKRIDDARSLLAEYSLVPEICSRLCPKEDLCTGHCILSNRGKAIETQDIERFVAEKEFTYTKQASVDVKVVIIGTGPSGLACGHMLLLAGFHVVFYEKNAVGGIPVVGIPDSRYDKSIYYNWIEKISELGAEFRTGELGLDVNVDDLASRFDYVFLAYGAKVPISINNALDIKNVFDGMAFLEEYNARLRNGVNNSHNNIAIVGGGLVALDCCCVALASGIKNITLIYRRSINEVLAPQEEFRLLEEKGVKMLFCHTPIEFSSEKEIVQLRLAKTKLVPRDGARAVPVLTGEELSMDFDSVVLALGFKPDIDPIKGSNIAISEGKIVVDNRLTSVPNVYIGGDLLNGASNIASAMNDGYEVARSIIKRVTEKDNVFQRE